MVPNPHKNQFAKWIRPGTVLARLHDVKGHNHASGIIWHRLKSGDIASVAEAVFFAKQSKRENYVLIPHVWYENGLMWDSSDYFWTIGDFEATLSDPYAMRYSLGREGDKIQITGTILSPDDVDRMMSSLIISTSESTSAVASQGNKGGAPKKAFWDDLWIEVAVKLGARKLEPKSQADIERFMLDWASSKGLDLGETTVKEPARKLFAALNQKVRN